MSSTVASSLERTFAYIDERLDSWVAELGEWLRIPSVGVNDEAMARAREWILRRLARAGISAEALPAEPSHPMVVGRVSGSSARRLLFFNHYDVANYTYDVRPGVPEFTGEIRDGKLFGRGSADDKGCLFSRVAAVEALLATAELPVSLSFLMQGKREANDPGLAPFIARHRDLLQTDAVVWESGAKDEAERPVMSLGAKGYCYLDITVRRAANDFPSRECIYPNAAWDLTWALASLKGPDERIRVPGFYDDVMPLSAADEALLAELGQENPEGTGPRHGADSFLLGYGGADLARQLYLTPSCTICGLTSGYSGPGQKLMAPAAASAKVEFRLVPNQDPEDIAEKVRKHFRQMGLDHVEAEIVAHTAPYRTAPDQTIVGTARRAAGLVYDKPLVIRPVSTGMSPKFVFRPLPVIGLGVEYAGSRMEMPDEHIRIEDFRQGVKMIAALILEHAASMA